MNTHLHQTYTQTHIRRHINAEKHVQTGTQTYTYIDRHKCTYISYKNIHVDRYTQTDTNTQTQKHASR